MKQEINHKEYAQFMIRNHGWSVAHQIAKAEARPHSPTGNNDGFWSSVLAEIEKP